MAAGPGVLPAVFDWSRQAVVTITDFEDAWESNSPKTAWCPGMPVDTVWFMPPTYFTNDDPRERCERRIKCTASRRIPESPHLDLLPLVEEFCDEIGLPYAQTSLSTRTSARCATSTTSANSPGDLAR